MKTKTLLSLVATLAVGSLTTQALPINSGNLVIYRVGDGTALLGTTATAVFLDEYTVTGSLVQSIPVLSSGLLAMTATGNSTTEGVISRSQDGSTLVFGGYRAAAGSASPSGATFSKVIGTLTISGLPNTTVAITDATTAAMRSATSTDGSSLFYAGTSTGVRYVGSPSGASITVVIDTRNSRQVNLSGNTLFAANGSTTITGKVQHYGTLPTAATAATPIVTLLTTDAVNGFALFDLSPSEPGVDTVYALNTVLSQLVKWSSVGGAWTANGSISSTAQDLAGFASGSTVDLFLTTGTTLSGLTDSSGYNATLTGSLTSLATASVNTAFRGIGMLEVPEPSVWCLGLLGAGLLALRRRCQRAR